MTRLFAVAVQLVLFLGLKSGSLTDADGAWRSDEFFMPLSLSIVEFG